jgi:hypothetical protein
MAVTKKQILALIYKNNGTFIKAIQNFDFRGFTKEINAGVGELVIGLSVAFDYSGEELQLGNDVEIRISDKDTAAAGLYGDASKIIYRGYISNIERSVDGEKENVLIHVLGHYTLLGMDFLRDTTQTTLYSHTTSGLTTDSGSQGAADIGLMMRTILDQYAENTSNPKIKYVKANIPDAGIVATYSFEQKTYMDAIDIMRSMSAAGYFFYIDELGMVKFKSTPSTPTHRFVFGRHFSSIKVEQSLERIRNTLLVWNGESGASEVYKRYDNVASQIRYGVRAMAINDYGIDDEDAADAMGDKFEADSENLGIKITCTIFDNNGDDNKGYDIESIQPGDTCAFHGFDSKFSEIFKENMIITKVNYTLDRAEIEVEFQKSGVLDIQTEQGRKISDIGSGGLKIPETYTT